ncbi:MAG: SCO family protein [Anaerolineales bacterium]|nr:SCO family protein [Anaerolineales bacterium]MCZ2121208.1 SCO family protein [Anaerolineales bacterium]
MNKKIFFVGVAVLLVISFALTLSLILQRPASFRGTEYAEPYPVAENFSLTNSKGAQTQLSAYQGKVVILFFGYTYCPDVCPTTLADLKLVTEDLKEKADQTQVIFISVDPKRDTPDAVQKYVERFSPGFIGLSGTLEELTPVWAGYGIYREEVPGTSADSYIVNHSARILVIDQTGNLRLSYSPDTNWEDIAHDISILLKR